MIWPRQKKERIIENVAYWNGPDSFISHSDQILKIDAFDVLNSPTRSVRAFQFFFGYTFFSLGNYCFSFLEFFKVLFCHCECVFFYFFSWNDEWLFSFSFCFNFFLLLLSYLGISFCFSFFCSLAVAAAAAAANLCSEFRDYFCFVKLIIVFTKKKNDFFSPQTTTMENRIWKKNK